MAINFANGTQSQSPRSGVPESLHIHQPSIKAEPGTDMVPAKYFALAMVKLHAQMAKLAQMIEDNSRPVDEYQPQTLTPEGTANVTVPPQWEVTEVIRSIVVTGPTGACTLQLGDRTWNLVIPASQILVIAPIRMILSRQDVRILTAATPGQYNLELMGTCDERAS